MPLTLGERRRPAPWELRHRRLARTGGLLVSVVVLWGLQAELGRRSRGGAAPVTTRTVEVVLALDDPGDHLQPLSAPPVPVRPAELAPPGVDGSPDLLVQDAQVIGLRTMDPADPRSTDPMADQDAPPEEPSPLPPAPASPGEQVIPSGAGAARAARTGLMTRAGFRAGQLERVQDQHERRDAVKSSPYGEDGGLRVIKRVAPRYDERFMEPQQAVLPCLYDVSVAPSGIPESVRVLSCPSALEVEARRAVQQWRWATRPDELHTVPVQVLLRFHPPEHRRGP